MARPCVVERVAPKLAKMQIRKGLLVYSDGERAIALPIPLACTVSELLCDPCKCPIVGERHG